MAPLNVVVNDVVANDDDAAAAQEVVEVQEKLVDNNNDELKELEVDYDKNITSLYEAICNTDWDTVLKASEETPDDDVPPGEERKVMWRFLPIHSACARQPPASVIEALIKAYPDGPKCVDDQGMYPLHYACGNQASRETVRQLLVAYPYAAMIADPRGMLPIHYLSCWGPSSLSIIDMVLIANRDVANARDIDGNTPIDLALEGQYKESDVVVDLLRRWLASGNPPPSSISGKNSNKKSISIDTSMVENNDVETRDDVSVTTPRSTRSQSSAKSDTNNTLNKLRHEVIAMKQEKREFEKEKKAFTTDVAEKTKQIEDYQATIKELELQVKEVEMSKQKTVHDMEQVFEEKDVVLKERDDRISILTEQMAGKDTLYESTNFQLTKVDEELALLKINTSAKIGELEEQLKEKTDKLAESTKRMEYLDMSVADKEKTLATTRENLINVTRDLSDLKDEKEQQVTELTVALGEKSELLEEKEGTLDVTTSKLTETEEELTGLKERLDHLQGEHDKYKLKCYHVEEQLESILKNIGKMNQRNSYLRKQNINYNERLHSASELRYYKLKQLLTFEEELMKSLSDNTKDDDDEVNIENNDEEVEGEETAEGESTIDRTKLSIGKFDIQEKVMNEISEVLSELIKEGNEEIGG